MYHDFNNPISSFVPEVCTLVKVRVPIVCFEEYEVDAANSEEALLKVNKGEFHSIRLVFEDNNVQNS